MYHVCRTVEASIKHKKHKHSKHKYTKHKPECPATQLKEVFSHRHMQVKVIPYLDIIMRFFCITSRAYSGTYVDTGGIQL